MLKTTAWSVPVVAAAVATPLAAASVATASLAFAVTPLIDIDAPYGTRSIVISNTGMTDYSGPISVTAPTWTTTPPFTVGGATQTTVGGTTSWSLDQVDLAAGQTIVLDIAWAGPYPLLAEEQVVTVAADPRRATVTPSGEVVVVSPFQLLWFAVNPGGQGNAAGTSSFFVANTTETALTAASTIRMTVWTFPQPSVRPIRTGDVTYNGQRIAENGAFVGRYADVLLNVPARDGKQTATFEWGTLGGTQPVAQQARQITSITPDTAVPLTLLGTGTVYSTYRP